LRVGSLLRGERTRAQAQLCRSRKLGFKADPETQGGSNPVARSMKTSGSKFHA
jgi:hypothetical protein